MTSLLFGGLLLAASAPARADHSASTIDDTGSIFDESPSSSDKTPPPPATVKPLPPKPSPEVTPKPPTVKPAEPKPAVEPVKPKTPALPASPTPKPIVAKKLPVPTAKAQEASLKLVHELYQTDIPKTAPADQRLLAQKMLEQSRDAGDDVAARYVLLTEASNRAATAGDGLLAMKAIRGLARTFQTDAPTAALAALTLASKANVPADQLNTTARAALDFSREAVLADELATASVAADIAQAAGRRGKDAKLLKVLKQQADRVAELRRGADEVKDAALKLKVDPKDAAACQAVGRYRCFVRGDWSAGLRLLSRSNDAALKPLALKDIALRDAAADADQDVPPADATKLADAWWAASEPSDVDIACKIALQTRACYWYGRAASGLTGLKRVQLEKKINQVRTSRLKAGLVGHYFNNHYFKHEVMERIDTQINFNWKDGSPAPGVNADGFAVWWSGYIKAPAAGKYKLVSDQDDGCRIFVDGKLVIDQWHELHEGIYTANVDFTSEPQSLYIEYVEVNGAARMGLGWQVPGSNKPVTIPQSALFHEPDAPLKIPAPRPADVGRAYGHSYKLIESSVPWYEARQRCEDLGGHLVMIETPQEQQFINAMVAGRTYFIGLNDEEEEGVWRWTNGRQPNFIGWAPGEPNGSENANFATTFHDGWDDSDATFYPFICEWDD